MIVVMDPDQERYLSRYLGISAARIIIAGDLDPDRAPKRAIEDPFQRSESVFAATYDRLERCAQTLVRCLRRDWSS